MRPGKFGGGFLNGGTLSLPKIKRNFDAHAQTPHIRHFVALQILDVDAEIGIKILSRGRQSVLRTVDHPLLTFDFGTVFQGGLIKAFERERQLDTDKLASLKRLLETSLGQKPRLMMRRLKEHELRDLPPIRHCPLSRAMPPPQRAAYEQAVRSARTADSPGAVLSALQQLRSISLHPEPDAAVSDEAFILLSARLAETVRVLDECAARHESVLVFLDHLDMQARLAGLIQRRYGLARAPEIINGTVAGHRRQAFVDAFQKGEGFDVMILSPRAGGVGLTLTRANHVIHLSRWWNPAVEDQCTGRVYRIGQSRDVQVHLPLATLDGSASFDQNLDQLIARKRRLMHDALVPPEATAAADQDELFRSTVGT